jgi:hypothetical protein
MSTEKQNAFCVPFALGMIAAKTPNEIARLVQEEMKDFGAVRGVMPFVYLNILKNQLGIKITAEVRRPGMTIRKWAANRAKWGDKSPWLIRKSGHVMVYLDSMIYDNHIPNGAPAATHKFATGRLIAAHQVAA